MSPGRNVSIWGPATRDCRGLRFRASACSLLRRFIPHPWHIVISQITKDTHFLKTQPDGTGGQYAMNPCT
jgi:hypothetical protein